MKTIVAFLIIILSVSCTNNSKEDTEVINAQKFYYPIEDLSGKIVYQYDLSFSVNGEEDSKAKEIYNVIERIDAERISMSTYTYKFELMDSAVLNERSEGVEVVYVEMFSPEKKGSMCMVEENLIFPWKRTRNEKSEIVMDYEREVFDAACSVAGETTTQFERMGKLKKGFNGEKEFLKLKMKTVSTYVNKETGEIVKNILSGYVIDLKGVGLYRSYYTDNYGVKFVRTLNKILTSEEWDQLKRDYDSLSRILR